MIDLRDYHRTADRYTILILAERHLPGVLLVGEVVVGVELVVAQVFVGAAVQAARAGLDDDIDVGTRGAAELGRRIVRARGTPGWRPSDGDMPGEFIIMKLLSMPSTVKLLSWRR